MFFPIYILFSLFICTNRRITSSPSPSNYIIVQLSSERNVHCLCSKKLYIQYPYIIFTVKIQLTAKLSTSRTPKKYTNVQSRVAMNAVTATNRNQCVDAIRAGEANDMQIIPSTCRGKRESEMD